MKILLYSKYFLPNIGGVEIVSDNLATAWSKAGQEVTVVTTYPAREEIDRPYKIVRHPSKGQLEELVKSHDVIYSNGANLLCYWPARKHGKPFAWTHYDYQLQTLDGCGWLGESPSPLTPFASIVHHARKRGLLPALKGAVRLYGKRLVGQLVDANVAITKHVAARQPLPRQVVIYNPISSERFAVSGPEEALDLLERADATFTFLGRLDSNKGISDLIKAFAIVCGNEKAATGDARSSLKLIGDGPYRPTLEKLAVELGVSDRIIWKGLLPQAELTREVRASGICVLPSAIEEPMGIVVVELMAAGKPLIVSAVGGLSECAGDAAKTFQNGDWRQLAAVMQELSINKEEQRNMALASLRRSAEFKPQLFSDAYLQLFQKLMEARSK
jgi:glycosyltransferase involved in cell wall biosynthesis